MFKSVFLKKKFAETEILRWYDPSLTAVILEKKVPIEITEIKTYKRRYYGVSNDPKAEAHNYVFDAMEVHGEIIDPKTEYKKVYLLVPEFEIEQYHVKDKVILWIGSIKIGNKGISRGHCFKIETFQ